MESAEPLVSQVEHIFTLIHQGTVHDIEYCILILSPKVNYFCIPSFFPSSRLSTFNISVSQLHVILSISSSVHRYRTYLS